MRRVKQQDPNSTDCGIACAAIIADCEYGHAYRRAIRLGLRAPDGSIYTYHVDLLKLLKSLGVNMKRKRFVSLRTTEVPSIVKVNPREDGRYWHWVVITRKAGKLVILDPNPRKPDRITKFFGYKGCGTYLHANEH